MARLQFILSILIILLIQGCGDDNPQTDDSNTKLTTSLTLYSHQEVFTLPSTFEITFGERLFKCTSLSVNDIFGTIERTDIAYFHLNNTTYCSLPNLSGSIRLPATVTIEYDEIDREGNPLHSYSEQFDYEGSVTEVTNKPVYNHGLETISEFPAETIPFVAAADELDYSGAGVTLKYILNQKFRRQLTELDVLEGLFTYGNQEQIIERNGFSLYDVQQYVEAIGYHTGAYRYDSSSSKFQNHDLNTHLPFLTALNISGYSAFYTVVGISDTSFTIIHPFFGFMSFPIEELTSKRVLPGDDLIVMLFSSIPFE